MPPVQLARKKSFDVNTAAKTLVQFIRRALRGSSPETGFAPMELFIF
jgi:hypothetical protein